MTDAYKKSRDESASKELVSYASTDEFIAYRMGADWGYNFAINGVEVSALVAAVSNALEYYQSTSYCSLNCDPLVNHHEPECCIEVSLRQKLAAFQTARDAQKAEGEK